MEKPDIIISSMGHAGIGQLPEGRALLEAWRAEVIGGRELEERLKRFRLDRLLSQQEAGVDWIPVGDLALRDRMLDHAAAFGLAPEPHGNGPSHAFHPACGSPEDAGFRTKPWYGASGRYVVPELAANAEPRLVRNPWVEAFLEARAILRALPVPVMIGPYTFAKLADGLPTEEKLERLAPVYAEALRGLGEAGAEWAQLEEPELARPVPPEHWPHIGRAYRALHDAAPKLRLMLQLPYGAPDDLTRLLSLPAAGVGLDFTAGEGRALLEVAKRGFPADRVLGAGVIDGRRIWRSDLRAACGLLENLRRLKPQIRLALQPSCSLAHAPAAPADGRAPHGLPAHALATAGVKLRELRVLRDALAEGRDAVKLDLIDSDVLQEMLRALLPAAVPADAGQVSAGPGGPPSGRKHAHAPGHAGSGPACGGPAAAKRALGTA